MAPPVVAVPVVRRSLRGHVMTREQAIHARLDRWLRASQRLLVWTWFAMAAWIGLGVLAAILLGDPWRDQAVHALFAGMFGYHLRTIFRQRDELAQHRAFIAKAYEVARGGSV